MGKDLIFPDCKCVSWYPCDRIACGGRCRTYPGILVLAKLIKIWPRWSFSRLSVYHQLILLYFQGLGRRTFPDRCQHYSNNLITWSADSDARSCYMASYQGAPGADNNRYRRFPRVHPEAKPSSAPLATTTTKWFQRPDVPYKTPLHVMAITQEPFLSPNKWVYSYRPIWR